MKECLSYLVIITSAIQISKPNLENQRKRQDLIILRQFGLVPLVVSTFKVAIWIHLHPPKLPSIHFVFYFWID